MTGCPVRPGHVCAEKDRKLAKLSYLPDCVEPSPASIPTDRLASWEERYQALPILLHLLALGSSTLSIVCPAS